ncbi:hypothetical protein [Streptomyces sp. NPDC003327]
MTKRRGGGVGSKNQAERSGVRLDLFSSIGRSSTEMRYVELNRRAEAGSSQAFDADHVEGFALQAGGPGRP